MRVKLSLYTAVLLSAMAALAACGGGGGGGAANGGALPPTVGGAFPTGLPGQTPSPVPSGTPLSTPSSGATATPTPGTSPTPLTSPTPGITPTPGPSSPPGPTPTPTAIPTGYFAQGLVRDFASGLPIAGATVVLAPQVYAGSTPPPFISSGSQTTTAADGSFTVTGVVPGSNYVEVFQNGYATIHKPAGITQFNNQLGILRVTLITAHEAAWLQKVNADRAQYGAPSVVLDEILQEAAQYWDDYMANHGYFRDDCAQSSDPSCITAAQYEQNAGAQYTHSAQNIAATGPGSTWMNAEDGFLNESANCPQPAVFKTCQGQTTASHFLNLINPQFVWIGLAEHKNGNSYNPIYGPLLDYYTQEFGTPFQ